MNNKTMKKWFSMFVLFLLAGFSGAYAQKLTLADVQVKAGETAELTIKLESGASTVYGIQADIVLPKGLTMEAPKAVAGIMADGSDAVFSTNKINDSYRIAAFSIGGVAFKANTAVATFTVKAADDFSNVNGNYVGITLTNIKFTIDTEGKETEVGNVSNEVDAGLDTFTGFPSDIDFDDAKVTPVGIVTYAADREGAQVSGMQPVKGWYAASNGDARAAGVFAAGSATSFLGSEEFHAPAADGNVLGLLAVWTATAQYKKDIFLKAGKYFLTVNVYNDGGDVDVAKNLIGFVTEDGEEFYAETTQYPEGQWTQETIRIVLADDTYGSLSLGYTAQDASKYEMPHLFFDGVFLQSSIFPDNTAQYTIECPRGKIGVDGTALVALHNNQKNYNFEASNFALITYNDNTYLWSVKEKRFINSNGVLTNIAPEPITLVKYDPAYQIRWGANCLNVNGNGHWGYVINTWTNLDDGNKMTIVEAADFDPAEALAVLANPATNETTTILDLADVSNDKAYYVVCPRAAWLARSGDPGLSTTKAAYDAPVNEMFALLQSGGKYYFYSISAKKFFTKDNKLSDTPEEVLVSGTNSDAYPFFFKFDDSHVVNINDNGFAINGWSNLDDGNRFVLYEAGDFDPSEAMALLPATVGNGDYVIENVGTGQFFFGGNNWGTRASTVELSQYMILHELEDGKFRIESLQNNGGESYWVGWGNASTKEDIYVDCTADRAIDFELVSLGDGIYNIVIAENGAFLAAPEEGSIIEWIEDGTAAEAQWRITRTADMLKDATEDDPVDATFLIKDNDFDRNNRWNSTADTDFGKAWTMNAGNQNMSGGNNENRCAESWHSTFEMTQVIANAPKGVYKLSAQGFYRDDSEGNLKKLPVLFANDKESAFPEIKDEEIAGRGNIRDQGVAQMGDCSVWFADGDYPIDPVFFELDEAGDITLGVKYQEPELLWAIWDKFELTYYGPDADINSVQLDGRDDVLDVLLAVAEDLVDDGYPEDITIALGHAIQTGNDAEATNPPSVAAYDKAIAELEAAIKAANDYVFPATEIEYEIDMTCGGYYEGEVATVDIDAILAALGADDLDDVTIAAVQPDGTYDTNYKLGQTDGWRNAEGGWEYWGASAYFYVKADFSLPENQLYEMGCYPGKSDAPATYTATYSFRYGKHEVLLYVNLVYIETTELMYQNALAAIEDGASYCITTDVDGTKYYLTADGTLSADKADAGTFSFLKSTQGGLEYEYGFRLTSQNGKRFSNPVSTNEAAMTNGSLNATTNNRIDWESQVFFLNSDGLYAVRGTNAPYSGQTSGWNWIGNTYWTAYDGPVAGYSWEPDFIWQLEKNVLVDVACNLVDGGEIIATENVSFVVGATPAAPADFYDEMYGLVEGFECDVEEITAETTEINFTAISILSESLENAKWYNMNIRSGWYVSKCEEEPYTMNNAPTDDELNSPEYQWAFMAGDEPGKVIIYNRAAEGQSLSLEGDNVVLRDGDFAWEVFANAGGFVLRDPGTENRWVNQVGGGNAAYPLGIWDSAGGRADDGSTFRVEAIEAILEMAYEGVMSQTLSPQGGGEAIGSSVTAETIVVSVNPDGTANIAFAGFNFPEPMNALAVEDFVVENIPVTENPDGSFTFEPTEFQISVKMGMMDVSYAGTLEGVHASAEAVPGLHIVLSQASINDIWFAADEAALEQLKTAISGVKAESNTSSIYDLSGRKINKIQKGGIYIVNGKKVAVK